MSRLYEYYIDKLYNSNPYAYAQHQKEQLESEELEYTTERNKWLDGTITLFNGGTVETWVKLGRPRNNNATL